MKIAAVLAFQAVPASSPEPQGQSQGQVTQPAAPVPAQPQGSMIGGLLPLLIFVPLIALLFWQSRSQQKKQAAVVAGLKKGDKVVTQSGIVGRLQEIEGRYARIEVAPGVKLQILSSSLVGRDADPSAGKGSDKGTEAGGS
ncbi:MAG TPA: preprotein translocase subunit YajC [Polyangiaceae bacterium]|nr:preprotein translocase subunit YajC [Polyangiaceae bacterium]